MRVSVEEFTLVVETQEEKEFMITGLLYWKDNAGLDAPTQGKINTIVAKLESVPDVD